MKKHVKHYLTVDVTAPGAPLIRIEGREFTSERKQHEGNECFLWLTPSEAAWLRDELTRAIVEATGKVHP